MGSLSGGPTWCWSSMQGRLWGQVHSLEPGSVWGPEGGARTLRPSGGGWGGQLSRPTVSPQLQNKHLNTVSHRMSPPSPLLDILWGGSWCRKPELQPVRGLPVRPGPHMSSLAADLVNSACCLSSGGGRSAQTSCLEGRAPQGDGARWAHETLDSRVLSLESGGVRPFVFWEGPWPGGQEV